MVTQLRSSSRQSAGFSLVEVMIGLLIGMIAVIVMMQVFSVSEGYKRTTTGGDDAQNNGAIALYALQRDLRQSGHGANAFHLIGCNVNLRAGVTLNAMGPVTINHASIPAGDANTDRLLVVYGNSNGSPEGERIEAQPNTTTYTVSTPTAPAVGPGSFAAGDRVIAEAQTRPAPCNLTMETVVSTAAVSNVTVGTGVAGMSGGVLYNLGPAPKVLAYAVRGGNLTVCDYMLNDCSVAASVTNPAIWVPVASNVVSLRAQYGQDTTVPNMNATVDVYNQTTPATECAWARVSAIQLALVARSANYEKDNVTTAAPAWAGSAGNAIDLSGNPTWQHYRYKVFQTVVPQRNMAWMGVQAGC